jgi:hypothetical protein
MIKMKSRHFKILNEKRLWDGGGMGSVHCAVKHSDTRPLLELKLSQSLKK